MIQTVSLKSNIGKLRNQSNLTQLELSQIVGVTETTIANWEKGRSGLVWIDRVLKMCRALDCTLDELISYEHVADSQQLNSKNKKLSDLRSSVGTERKPSPIEKMTG